VEDRVYKQIILVLLGGAIGALAMIVAHDPVTETRFAAPVERTVVDDANMSSVEAESHRRERYAGIQTIEEVLALPSDFAETEALYTIAGRAGSDEVQNLIYQAMQIRERDDRRAAVAILLLRLTELDPLSALAIARSPQLANESGYETSVWLAWGRLDFDAALESAINGNATQKSLAAQALYRSLRGIDTAKYALIKSRLGLVPDRNARGQNLYALADESPVAAIHYIESLRSADEQQMQFRWLAYHLHRTGRAADMDYAVLIQSEANRRIFEQAVTTYRAKTEPEIVIREALAAGWDPEAQSQIYGALSQLAKQDPERALRMLDELPDDTHRANIESVVAAALATSDPQKALNWVRGRGGDSEHELYQSVVLQIAQRDPQLALTEARSMEDPVARDRMLASIISVTARLDPAQAKAIYEIIEDPSLRSSAVADVVVALARTDVSAAGDFILTLTGDEQHNALRRIGHELVEKNLDGAMQLLGKVPDENAGVLRRQVAQQLSSQRNFAEAQTFISRFRGSEDYSQLQIAILAPLAASDPVQAMNMSGDIEDPTIRDRFRASVIGQQAAQDPQRAVRWLGMIDSESGRSDAIRQVAQHWMATDPTAANAWVQSLPRGADRDAVIAATMYRHRNSPEEARRVIESIDNPNMRRRALISHLQSLARSNPAAARRLLDESSVTAEEREALRGVIDGGYYGSSVID